MQGDPTQHSIRSSPTGLKLSHHCLPLWHCRLIWVRTPFSVFQNVLVHTGHDCLKERPAFIYTWQNEHRKIAHIHAPSRIPNYDPNVRGREAVALHTFRACSASAVKLCNCGIGSNCRGGSATAAQRSCSRTSRVGS